MELIIEISKEEAGKLGLSDTKLTYAEFRRKIAGAELIESLEKSHQTAKKYGIDEWTTEDISNLVKEAKTNYNEKSGD
jgi:hypothetical protein